MWTMDLIANSMPGTEDEVDRPVLDRTGLTEGLNFAIEFTPKTGWPIRRWVKLPDRFHSSEFSAALKEQLGLKLEAQMGANGCLRHRLCGATPN